jgi:outer membrane protein assembly factor BamA
MRGAPTDYSNRLVAVVIVFVVLGCAGSRERRDVTGVAYVIDDVHLVGVTRFKKRELIKYLYLGETSWLPFTDTYYYNEALVPFDAEKIVALYKSYGYFDAEVLEIKPVVKKRRKADVVITIREGEPVRVRQIGFDWQEEAPTLTTDRPVSKSEVERLSRLKVGDPLETPLIEASLNAMRRRLQADGFALARTTAAVSADPQKRTAAVTFRILPGRWARIGRIRFRGLESVPEKMATAEVDFAKGEPFSLKIIEKMERKIYAMDVFSTVEVVPGDSIDDDGRIPITVVVRVAKMQSVKLGAGLGFEPSRWEERITAQYSNRDIFGDLVRLDVWLQAGYAELPTPFNLLEHGPVARFTPRLTKKGWLEKRLVWTIAPSIELGVEEGYKFYTPGTRIGVSRFFGEIFQTELSHNFKFFDFFQLQKSLDANRTLLGLDFHDPYLLSYWEIVSSLYLADRILDPDNGVILIVRYDVAGGIFGGHYDYHKVAPELSAYWRIISHLQLALRAATGYIFPYGDRPAAPFDMKYYLGGSDTVRGWGPKRLSPKTENCPEAEETTCRRIPIGGKTFVLGNVEMRVRTIEQLDVVAFLDVGDVQPGEVVYHPTEWNLSSGGGLRWASPVGKVRLDVGARLNDTPLSRGEDRWAFHLGLGESF